MEIIFVSYILAGVFLMWFDRDRKNKKSNVIYVDFLSKRKLHCNFSVLSGRQNTNKEIIEQMR